MQKRRIIVWLGIISVLSVHTTPTRAILSASPGKNTAAASAEFTGDPITPPSTINVVIAKGKKKRLLMITVHVRAWNLDNAPPAFTYSLLGSLTVNGHGDVLELTDVVADANWCPATFLNSDDAECTKNVWMDIDQAETTYPGEFVKQPLNIEATITPALTLITDCAEPGDCPFQRVSISLTAQMVKK